STLSLPAALPSSHQAAHGVGEAQRLGQVLGNVVDAYAQVPARDLPLVDQVLGHFDGHLDGDGEAYSHIASGAGVDAGVDAHHLAFQVHQRPAGIARVHGRVGLDVILVRVALLHLVAPALRRNDAR